MKRAELTTRKTSIGYLIGQVIFDALFLIFGIVALQKVDSLRSMWRFSQAEAASSTGVICIIFAIVCAAYHVMVSTTYVDIYDDGVKGKGLQKITAKDFRLRYQQITDISCSKGFLNIEASGGMFLVITTSAGSYKIITTEKRAKEIVEYYQNNVFSQA